MRLTYKQAINYDGYVGQIIFFNINTKGTKRSQGRGQEFFRGTHTSPNAPEQTSPPRQIS